MSASHDRASESSATSSIAADAPAASDASAAARLRESFDPLSDALAQLRLRGALFFLWDATWPYATTVPQARAFAELILPGAEQIVSYHVVTEGPCWAAVDGERPVRLDAGDILLIPHGDAYVMSSAAGLCTASGFDATLAFFRSMAAGELPFTVVEGGGGPGCTRVICGFLGCDVRPFNPVLAALPRMLVLRGCRDEADPLTHLIELTLAEARTSRPGGRCVLLRLSELMFVEVIRRCVTDSPAGATGWLAGLRDEAVGRALALLHGEPGFPWTLERLARAAHVSRSTLAERFVALVGQPPMHYLASWRMQLAARQLVDGTAKVRAIAHELGYESEAAFTRAFKKLVGVAPAHWRAAHSQRAHRDAGRRK